jgi:hypothetical protein
MSKTFPRTDSQSQFSPNFLGYTPSRLYTLLASEEMEKYLMMMLGRKNLMIQLEIQMMLGRKNLMIPQ